MRKNLLITALPGAGKTTVLRRFAESLGGPLVRGFLTDELREGGERRPDSETWEVTHLNRDGLPAAVLQWLAERGVGASRAG